MAATATNGTLTPPSLPPAPSSPSLAKRKRTDTDASLTNGASTAAPVKPVNGVAPSLQSVVEDILSVLKSYDTHPSILNHTITASASRASSGEADTKRAKLTPPAGPPTILKLAQSGAYTSLEALEHDVENAAADILASIGTSDASIGKTSPEEARILAFRKMLKSLVAREELRLAHIAAKSALADGVGDKDAEGEEDDEVVEIKEEVKDEEIPESRTVLTIFGNAQGPKQLFSSLQQPRIISPSDQISTLDTSVPVTLPLRESTLPNIISTTQVFPLPDDVDDKGKENVTIGKLFKAPAHLPQLSPPKLAKPLTTKGSTVTFAPPETPKPSRKSSYSYANQNLSAGYWLGYGGVDMPKDPTSPTAKQKSRQRALSTGEAQQPPSHSTLVAIKQAKEDALFRSAYSSFAPSRDDSTAIVPEETKNMVWWQKVGEKRFNEVFPIDPALLGEEEPSEDVVEDEEDAFKEAAEGFEPIDGGVLADSEEKTTLEKSTEEVLKDISELLETLASHQRIRNSSLATNPRTPVIQNSSLASLAGSPSTPSEEEMDVYQMLKAQLALMISQLPPYAVAKLNGDQLDELNISRTILVETKPIHGVLEEDHLARLAKAPAAAAVPPPSLSRMTSTGSGTHSHYPPSSAQYARSTPVVQSSTRPAQSAQSYFPQQQSVHRSPSVHYARSSSGPNQGYQNSSTSYSSTTRSTFPATQPYGQQTSSRTSYAQATPGQYYSQRPTQPSSYGVGAAASQFYGSTSQTPSHASRYPQQQAQNGYYPRPQPVAPMYTTAAAALPSPSARTASPLKAAPAATQQPPYSSRPGYGTPGGQLRSTYYPPSQYGNPQPQTPASGAASTAYAGLGSGTHQQMMLDRQQAQVAAQSQARLAAQNSFNRQGSGTPQPGTNGQQQYAGGGGSQQANGTGMMT